MSIISDYLAAEQVLKSAIEEKLKHKYQGIEISRIEFTNDKSDIVVDIWTDTGWYIVPFRVTEFEA
jgi:hypothetical protein